MMPTHLDIDWEEQWEAFAPGFHSGLAHVDLSSYGTSAPLLLKPGAGFGDFSHPTTRLALELMAPRAAGKAVIDIGCGSGILMLAGLMLRATAAIGIDIDEAALIHAQENARLNDLSDRTEWVKQLDPSALPKSPILILFNMISSEQRVAWESQKALHGIPAEIITSGILSSQKNNYYEMTREWGWRLVAEKQEGEWMGFVFIGDLSN